MEPSEYVVDLAEYWFDELISPGAMKAAEVAERCGDVLVGSVVQRSKFLEWAKKDHCPFVVEIEI